MNEQLDRLHEALYAQYRAYDDTLLKLAERAPAAFLAGDWEARLSDDLDRHELYRRSLDASAAAARDILGSAAEDRETWDVARRRFQERYDDRLATTYFTSVMRRVFDPLGIWVEFADDGIDLELVDPERLVHRYPLHDPARLAEVLLAGFADSVFGAARSPRLGEDADLLIDVVQAQLPPDRALRALELLEVPFFRGSGAYLVGCFRTTAEPVPVVISVTRSADGARIDAVVAGFRDARSFLLSSTRSAFTVQTRHHRELYSYLQRLFPHENAGYILEVFGFTQPAKTALIRQLRRRLAQGYELEHIGTGSVSVVFGLAQFPLVFKVLRADVPDREGAILNFTRVRQIDRLGQVLGSHEYRNLALPRSSFSDELLALFTESPPDDVIIGAEDVVFRRLLAVRRVVPLLQHLAMASPREAERVLLEVGWNIKHLAAMGLLPLTMGLEHFGLTTWNRVVYLNNAWLFDIRQFHFSDEGGPPPRSDQLTACPPAFERDLDLPEPHRDVFRAVHGDLFLSSFWQERQRSILDGRAPVVFPYAASCRLESARFRREVWEELQRASDTAEAHRIHLVLDRLAIVDVELAGLSFLRLEVRDPKARVLVLEPIGPEIIAQLHRTLQDVTFDILQAKSEVIEASGQWTPGIHGKLKALVQVRDYDYVIGYVNETFDAEFFRLARLQGFLLLSTGTHNIDVAAATATHTVVTNAPGPTTTTVAEQNIGLILDSIHGRPPTSPAPPGGASPVVLAQRLWLTLLRETLRLHEMFSFGASELYVRTGVGDRATVYHDQVGQNHEAGIQRSVGVLGVFDGAPSEVGLALVELAAAHEVSTIYVDEEEYRALPPAAVKRLEEMIAAVRAASQTAPLSTELVAAPLAEVCAQADYLFEVRPDAPARPPREGQRCVHVADLGPGGLAVADDAPLVLGIQGLGRIGEAVAQRALVLGFDVLVHQRSPERPKYQDKRARLLALAARCRPNGRPPTVTFTEDKAAFFRGSHVVTTLSATTDETFGWVDASSLSQLARDVGGAPRAIVSVGKGLVNEGAMIDFLKRNPDAEARLDVLLGEHEGQAYRRLAEGAPVENLRVTGHTAAAVREVRRLKVLKALDNLRRLIDGRIPPNIINETGRPGGVQRIVELEGLKFFRMEVPSAAARVLVIEPLTAPLVLQLQQQFPDVDFDILLAESEIVEVDGRWEPGINSRLRAIVSARAYDYCLGYCNADFDQAFFESARLKGLVLFATATHHIDVAAATAAETVVTHSPGFTTVAVTEQNIAMAMEALYGRRVTKHAVPEATALHQIDSLTPQTARGVAQLLWFKLLERALRLEAMYEFGGGGKYVRTGLRGDATVYHDQLGQHRDAGIEHSLGILGLDEVGVHLVELALAHELSTIYVLQGEYADLDPADRDRLEDLADLLREVSTTKGLTLELRPVEREELLERASYVIKTPAAYRAPAPPRPEPTAAITIRADAIRVDDLAGLERSFVGLTFGVQGLGRIGEAVVQRALALGANVVVCQRDPDRPRYQEKQARLRRLARHRADALGTSIDVTYVDKEALFRRCHVVTTLASTTSSTRFWVDREALDQLGTEAPGPVRIFVNAGKGLLNEAALEPYLREHPEVEVRLDVLSDEQRGGAGQRFTDREGRPLANVRIAGHTAAAVPELRRLKVLNALDDLRRLLDGRRPKKVVNPEVGNAPGDETSGAG